MATSPRRRFADAPRRARTARRTPWTRLIAKPSAETLAAAREAWKAARIPYQQTEVYRFGNAIVDDWEGRVNAWPLDEGLIDYVDGKSYGDRVRTTTRSTPPMSSPTPRSRSAGDKVDATNITPRAPADTLQEAGDIEANVATGYHAIEFLLWGQDLNGTEPGAGNRPSTDYDTANCTGGHCERRAAYLKAASDLLVADLTGDGGQLEGRRRGARRRSPTGGADGGHRPPSSPAWARSPMANWPASA